MPAVPLVRRWHSGFASARRRSRRAPFQPGESRIVAVERDPFAAPLDRQRGIPCVSDTRTARIGLDTQALEDVPVTIARNNNLAMRQAEQIFSKSNRVFNRTGYLVRARVGR